MTSPTKSWVRRRGLLRGAVACLLTAAPASSAGALFAPADSARVAAPPGHAEWSKDGRRLPDPTRSRPPAVKRFFDGLDGNACGRLVRQYPGVVGNLDGVPITLRLAANHRSMTAAGTPYAGRRGQFLVFDPRSRGRIARVFGDLANAQRIVVLVPGAGNRADNFWYGNGGHRHHSPAVQAGELFRTASTLVSSASAPGESVSGSSKSGTSASVRERDTDRATDPRSALEPERVAVVAWLGYQTPAGLDRQCVRQDLAGAGAIALHRFVEGLVTSCPRATIALLGHSYGSTVIGLAAPRLPEAVTDIAVFGSPGMGVRRVDELRTDARVWAAEAKRDWIRWMPAIRLLGVGHGVRPADPAFGARTFSTADVREHNGYLESGTDSLGQLASIAALGACHGQQA